MSKMIEQEYRVRMVLDNLPVTMFDLDSDVGGTRVVWGGGCRAGVAAQGPAFGGVRCGNMLPPACHPRLTRRPAE